VSERKRVIAMVCLGLEKDASPLMTSCSKGIAIRGGGGGDKENFLAPMEMQKSKP